MMGKGLAGNSCLSNQWNHMLEMARTWELHVENLSTNPRFITH